MAAVLTATQLRVLTGAGLSVSHVDPAEKSARRDEFVRVMLEELDAPVLPPKALQMARPGLQSGTHCPVLTSAETSGPTAF